MKSYKISIVLVILIYVLSGCGTTHIETQLTDAKGALPRCFCVEGKRYYFYGRQSQSTPKGEELRAVINTYTGENRILPTKDGETNFKEAIGCACVIDGEQLYIQIDEKWYETVSEETVKKMSEEASKKASLEAENSAITTDSDLAY